MALNESSSNGYHPKVAFVDFEKKTNERFSSLENSLHSIATDIHAIKDLMNTWITHVTDKEQVPVETVHKLVLPLVKTICWVSFAIVSVALGLKYASPILDKLF